MSSTDVAYGLRARYSKGCMELPAGRGLASFPKRGPETDAPPPIQEEVTEPGSGGSLLDPEQPAAEKVTTQPASGTA
eukprot:1487134-Rhodomonas_salina.1